VPFSNEGVILARFTLRSLMTLDTQINKKISPEGEKLEKTLVVV
jgi:hypothetical protein